MITKALQAKYWLISSVNWMRKQEMLYLSVLSIIVGVVTGYAALLLRFSIEWVAKFWTGAQIWEAATESLPWYIYLLAPTVTGLMVGWLLVLLLPNGELRGVAGVIEDLVDHGARINRKQMLTETAGMPLSLGGGISLGREGPTVAVSAAIASEIGHWLGVSEQQMRTLIGCGIAAGIAASFNTPIGGVMFALEIILVDYAIATFSPIVIAAVVATVITRSEVGNFPAFMIPQYHLVSDWEIIAYMAIGVICGLIAMLLIKWMAPTRALFAQYVPDRRFRPAVAGFMIGVMGLILPQVMSIGYGTVESMLLARVDPTVLGVILPLSLFLSVVLVAKFFAVIISFASGFPGGLLGPALFLGAATGGLFGGIVHDIAPALTEGYGAYALVACGALTAAALQAPITIMLMVFELSGDYHIMLPLMAACIVATLVKRAFGQESVFTEALEERGVALSGGLEQSWMRAVKVTRIPWRPIPSISAHAHLSELKRIYVESGKGCVIVVDDGDEMIGIISFADLQPWILDSSIDELAVAAEVANRNVQTISEQDNLLTAIRIFDQGVFEQVPIVAKDNARKVLGVLSRNAVFSTYHKMIVKHGE